MEIRALGGSHLAIELLATQKDAVRKQSSGGTSSLDRSTTASCSFSELAGFASEASDARDELDPVPLFDGRASGSFEDAYELLDDVLGTGRTGCVRRARSRATGKRVAVKRYCKLELRPQDLECLRREAGILAGCAHPSVVRLEHVYETDTTVLLIMEELEGGEVWTRLEQQKRFREAEAAEVVAKALEALAYLHSKGIAHRDVKPENLVYAHEDRDSRSVTLVDFGFAAEVGGGLTAPCGTLGYAAPEVLSGRRYDESCDLWSAGSLLYLLLTGRQLFEGTEEEVVRMTRTYREPVFGMEFWCLHEDAQELLRSLLHANPEKRPSAREALAHPWFARAASKKV